MDESGDGKLNHEEILNGAKVIMGELYSVKEDEAKKILDRVNIDGKIDEDGEPYIEFKDYLIACVNYEDDYSLLSYMENAYNILFDNEFEAMDT